MRTSAHILLIDDQESILSGLGQLLSNKGYSVSTATGGKRALELLETRPCDCVISDLKLPGITGIELLKTVREREPDLPFILVSAYFTPEDVIEALRAGASDCFSKPFDPDRVSERIDDLAKEKGIKATPFGKKRTEPRTVRVVEERFLAVHTYRDPDDAFAVLCLPAAPETVRVLVAFRPTPVQRALLTGAFWTANRAGTDFEKLADFLRSLPPSGTEHPAEFVLFEMDFSAGALRFDQGVDVPAFELLCPDSDREKLESQAPRGLRGKLEFTDPWILVPFGAAQPPQASVPAADDAVPGVRTFLEQGWTALTGRLLSAIRKRFVPDPRTPFLAMAGTVYRDRKAVWRRTIEDGRADWDALFGEWRAFAELFPATVDQETRMRFFLAEALSNLGARGFPPRVEITATGGPGAPMTLEISGDKAGAGAVPDASPPPGGFRKEDDPFLFFETLFEKIRKSGGIAEDRIVFTAGDLET